MIDELRRQRLSDVNSQMYVDTNTYPRSQEVLRLQNYELFELRRHSFAHDPPTTISNKETFPEDFLEILKPSLQNF